MEDNTKKPAASDLLAPAPHSSRGEMLSARLGFGSLRGRYMYAALFFILFAMAVAYVARTQVREAARISTANITEHEEIDQIIHDLAGDIRQTDVLLQSYLLAPERAERTALLGWLEHLVMDAKALAGTKWAQHSPGVRAKAEALLGHFQRLQGEIPRLMKVREDPRALFPAMPIIMDRILPRNDEFIAASTLALDEAVGELEKAGRGEVYVLFAEARHAWATMANAFRLHIVLATNRLDRATTGVETPAGKTELHRERLEATLGKLAALDQQGLLGPRQHESLARMRRLLEEWDRDYREVTAIHASERWRADVPLLHNVIRPLFDKSASALRELEKEMLGAATGDATALAAAAEGLSRTLVALSALGVVLTVLGYFFFEWTVRRPIARVARAMKAEAAGGAGASIPSTQATETRDLISAFDLMRDQVRTRQQRLEAILDNAAEGIITFDAWGRIESFNHAAEKLFGWAESEIHGESIGLLIAMDEPDKRDDYVKHFLRHEIRRLIGREGELTGRHKDGATFPMALKINRMDLHGREIYTCLVADISERAAMLRHLRDMAEHDGLTGLHNRSYFQEELERVVERARRNAGTTAALLYIDLDNFKYINDTLGHGAGDQLLVEVTALLTRRARRSDLIARFGGDEFTVLLYDVSQETAWNTAEAFRKRLAEYAFRKGGESIDIGCSIGVALINAETKSADETLSQADLACHLAKRGGRNRVHLFRASDVHSAETMALDMGWSRRIKEAIERGRFAIACQPIVNTRTLAVELYEVLIRMLGERDEIILPGGFLPAAERFGLSADIDRWVIANAIDTLADQRLALPELRYSINLSAMTLDDISVCDLIQTKLRQSGLDPAALVFEVTETVAISDMATAEAFLSRLRLIGCKTALDDFGSGMASFAYLKDLPVDYVKIDGRFVRGLAASPVEQAMVRAMNDVAHALGKQTVAEFVENEESFQLLVQYGVDYAQGYHLGRPDIALPCRAIAERVGESSLCQG